MTSILWISVCITLVFTAIFVLMIRRVAAGDSRFDWTPEWVQSLSPDRYRVMATLLAPHDFEFLGSFPGADRAMVRRFRADRRRVFRLYLKSLRRDFGRTCFALRLVMVHAQRDRSELLLELTRQQVRFQLGVWAIQCQLALDSIGLGHVDVRRVVGAFDALRLELRAAMPATAASAA
jgi:hypothetical protein